MKKQVKFKNSKDEALEISPREIAITGKEKILKGEFCQDLYLVDRNQSFKSSNGDSERSKLMFPDSNIARDYSQEETKTNYIVQFCVAPYINDTLVKDLIDTPFVFKFDKTTTQQINKQYDSFVSYYPSRFQRIFTIYVRSLFAGDFKSDDLVSHFFEFIEKPELHVDFLLALSMDSPNVTRLFEKKNCEKNFQNVIQQINKVFRCWILSLAFC